MKYLISLLTACVLLSAPSYADYQRNKAVPVQQVLFGSVESVRMITEQELVKDKTTGWETFGGALIGGVIGNQFGGGSGRTVATIMDAMIGGSVAHNRHTHTHVVQ